MRIKRSDVVVLNRTTNRSGQEKITSHKLLYLVYSAAISSFFGGSFLAGKDPLGKSGD